LLQLEVAQLISLVDGTFSVVERSIASAADQPQVLTVLPAIAVFSTALLYPTAENIDHIKSITCRRT
jgi:hypothetical protein